MIPDFIEVYDNALSSSQCKEIIDWTEGHNLIRGGTSIGYSPLKKDCFEVPNTNLTDNHFVNDYISKSLFEHTQKYRDKYWECHKPMNEWQPKAQYNIQKYYPGQGYHHKHCENGDKASSHRVLVWMFYLNTVTDDGGTYFTTYDRITDAVEGRLVIWPAYWTHTHCGVVSNTQIKYIITGWFVFR